jgi:hypothetical protein
MAAILAAGPGAVLSHRSAAELWRIRAPGQARVEVSRASWRTPGVGIQIHRALIPSDETTKLEAIPVTTVPRTILDLAAVLRPDQVERAINEAEVRRLTDPLSLDDLIRRYRGRRGVAVIRSILKDGRIGLQVTRSELESRFLSFLDGEDLPRPLTNAGVRLRRRWVECDCVWRSRRVAAELDGHAAHRTAAAYERDRLRDRELHAAGWRVIRITWRQLDDDPIALAADLRRMLGGI